MTPGQEMFLRDVMEEDSRDLWEWRNHPLIRQNFFDGEEVAWETHQQWFAARRKDPRTKILIAIKGAVKIGVIRFEEKEGINTVSVNVNPHYFGRGWGTRIVQEGTALFFKETQIRKPVEAEIKKGNAASQRVFQKAGYVLTRETNDTVVFQICETK